MPIYNDEEEYTVTNGGGTVNLDVTRSTVTRYRFIGTATLAAGYSVQATGTPAKGMEFDIRWQAVVTTAGANVVTVFGTVLTTDQALNDLIITCYYNGSAWDVDINQDQVEDVWEFGSAGNTTAQLANGGTSTSSASGAVNAGTNCTASGTNVFTAGIGNTASSNYSVSIGKDNTSSTTQGAVTIGSTNSATGLDSVAIGSGNVASGSNSFASGVLTDATGTASTAEGNGTLASASNTHAGGYLSIAARYGQFSRASGKQNDVNATDYTQFSKLTMFEQTTDATPTLLTLDGIGGVQFLTIPNNSIAYFRGEGVAIQRAGSAGTVGDNASFHFNGCITNIAGTTSLTDTVRWQDNAGAWGASASRTQVAAAATWSMVPTANNGTDTLDITVTGEANKTIYWLCNIELTEIRYTP